VIGIPRWVRLALLGAAVPLTLGVGTPAADAHSTARRTLNCLLWFDWCYCSPFYTCTGGDGIMLCVTQQESDRCVWFQM